MDAEPPPEGGTPPVVVGVGWKSPFGSAMQPGASTVKQKRSPIKKQAVIVRIILLVGIAGI
jgi:hypothetical protein